MADNGRFVCVGVDVKRDEDFDMVLPPKIGLSLVLESEYRGEDDFYEDSRFLIYPEGAGAVEFDDPSSVKLGIDIGDSAPKVWGLIERLKTEVLTDRAKTRFLRDLRIAKSDLPAGQVQEFVKKIERYLYEMLNFGDSNYKIHLNGRVIAIAVEDDGTNRLVEGRLRKLLKPIEASVVGIKLELDPKCNDDLRPCMIVGADTPVDSEKGWECLIVPIDSVFGSFKNTRPRRPLLGGVALRAFQTSEDVKDTVSSLSPEIIEDKSTADDDSPDAQFADMLMRLNGENSWHDDTVYNPDRQRFETRLDLDVAEIIQDYSLLQNQVEPTTSSLALSDESAQSILEALERDTAPKLRVQKGDQVEVSGKVFLCIDGKHVALSELGAEMVSGRYAGLALPKVKLGRGDEIQETILAFELKDCVFTDASGRQTHPQTVQIILEEPSGSDGMRLIMIEERLK